MYKHYNIYDFYEKICSIVISILMCASLFILMWYGKYNHPTGDDYYYTVTTRHIFLQTGSIMQTIIAAIKGVAYEYQNWQGTYSAMFFMYLAPNVFGDNMYKIFTTCILLLFTISSFYFFYSLLCICLKATHRQWWIISGVFVTLCIQTVQFAGESYFWYNGSMYYTGYFSLTLLFLGLVLKWLYTKKSPIYIAIMLLFAAFLAGGNYVSLLPCILIMCTISAIFIAKKSNKAIPLVLVTLTMLIGLFISAKAPGNLVRQSGLWEMPAYKAILKSIRQGIMYIFGWTRIWWLISILLISPIIYKMTDKICWEKNLLHRICVLGFMFGIFCSMPCPTFYAENSPGHARALAIHYYGFILFSFLAYGYILQFIKCCNSNLNVKQFFCKIKKIKNWKIIYAIIICLLLLIQLINKQFTLCNSYIAISNMLSGRAKQYEKEYIQRTEILENNIFEDVVFKPYTAQPQLIYVGDFTPDIENENNVKIAQYFNKKSIKVEY